MDGACLKITDPDGETLNMLPYRGKGALDLACLLSVAPSSGAPDVQVALDVDGVVKLRDWLDGLLSGKVVGTPRPAPPDKLPRSVRRLFDGLRVKAVVVPGFNGGEWLRFEGLLGRHAEAADTRTVEARDEIDKVLHWLWSAAVGTAGYVKAEWAAMDRWVGEGVLPQAELAMLDFRHKDANDDLLTVWWQDSGRGAVFKVEGFNRVDEKDRAEAAVFVPKDDVGRLCEFLAGRGGKG